MENKKLGIIIASVAVTLFVIVAFIFMYEPVRNTLIKPLAVQQKEVTFEFVCDYKSEQDAYEKAIEFNELNACNCIEDDYSAQMCQGVVANNVAFENAVSYMDVDLCEKINVTDVKESCIMLVKGNIEYFEEENPKYLARVYAQSHNEKSVEYLEKIIEENEGAVEDYIALAIAYAEQGLSEQEKGNDQGFFVKKGLDIVEKAIKIEPNNSDVYRAQAYVYEILPDVMMAVDSYTRAIELDKNNILAYVGRGHAYNMAGMLTLAHEDYQKAGSIDVDNKYMAVYSNLCRLESSRDDLMKSAIKNCLIVVNGDSDDPSIQSNTYQILGRLYIQKDDLDQAHNALLKAQSLTPSDPNVFVSMAQFYNKKQEFDIAKENATVAIKLSPSKATAYQELGNALYGKKQYTQAVSTILDGLAFIDEDVTLLQSNKDALRQKMYYSVADIYYAMGDGEQEVAYKEMGDSVFNNKN